jgi:hypothetical protein
MSFAKSRLGSEDVERDLGNADVRVNKVELHGVGQFTTPEPAAASGVFPFVPAGDGLALAACRVATALIIGLSASGCKVSTFKGDGDLADARFAPASQTQRELDWSRGSSRTDSPTRLLLQFTILKSSVQVSAMEIWSKRGRGRGAATGLKCKRLERLNKDLARSVRRLEQIHQGPSWHDMQ